MPTRLAIVSGILFAVACGAGTTDVRVDRDGVLAALARTPPVGRTFAARTSVPARWSHCTIPDSLASPIVCHSSRAGEEQLGMLALRVAAAMRDSVDAGAPRAGALLDLYGDASEGKSLERSLHTLRRDARRSGSADAWADLAAAELIHADHDADPLGRLRALDAATRAVSADSVHAVGRFDLALAAERLGLDGRARVEWERYVTIEHDTGWRREAAYHLASIDRRREHRTNSIRDAANSALARLDTAAFALEEAHGDRSIREVVEWLRTHGDEQTRRTAAALAGGQRANVAGNYAKAESLFALAASSRTPLGVWGRALHGVALAMTGAPNEAILALRASTREARRANLDAIEARAGWTLGVLLIRQGRRAEGERVLARVDALARALGDDETLGGLSTLRAEDRWASGDERAAWTYLLGALTSLRAHPASLRLRGALNLLAMIADDRGLSAAASVVHDEDAAVALASGHPEFQAEALLAGARSRLLQGDTSSALSALAAVRRTLATLPPSAVLRWVAAQAAQLHAMAGRQTSRAALDSAVSFFGEQRNQALLVEALLARAHSLAPSADLRAQRDLATALGLLHQRAAQWRTPAERRALERQVHAVGAQLAMALLARRDTVAALGALEASRESDTPIAGMKSVGDSTVVLDQLLVGDTLVTWRLGAGTIALHRRVVPGRAVLAWRDRLLESAEAGRTDEAASARLYDLLVRPFAPSLSAARRLVIIADEELTGIPFAMLRDTSSTGAFLVKRVAVQTSDRLADALTASRATPVRRPMFVGDPEQRLSGARREAMEAAALYPRSTMLTGLSATESTVVRAMRRADLVHVAAHARFDVERPEQSSIGLGRGGGAPQRLTARTISTLPLGAVRLAILSSCESTRSGIAGAPVTTGLAKAFHDAGVPGVVGALWRVDDDATADLMVAFHRSYRVTGDPVRALRDAQLASLRDARPARRNPAAWGAFVFTGR